MESMSVQPQFTNGVVNEVGSGQNKLCSDLYSESSTLGENGFHDTQPDASFSIDPRFFRVTECLEQTGKLYVGADAKNSCSELMQQLLGTALLVPTREEDLCITRARRFAMEQSIRMVLMKQTICQQQQQAHSLQRHQALVLMCRIYVGSISFELREDTVRNAFLPFGPIKSIDMSYDPIAMKHKGFAFIEFETPEAAQIAQDQMNNAILGGRNIKVGRPSNMPQAQVIINQVREEAKAYNRVYVAGVQASLSESDVRSVFEAFGAIVSCVLAKRCDGTHKGYCYIEYGTSQSADDSVAAMNLFDLGGQYLRVGRCVSPPDALEVLMGALPPTTGRPTLMPTASSLAAATTTAKLQKLEEEERRRKMAASGFAAQPTTLPPPGVVNVPQLGGSAVPILPATAPNPTPVAVTTSAPAVTPEAVAAAMIQLASAAAPLLQNQSVEQVQKMIQQQDPRQLQQIMQHLSTAQTPFSSVAQPPQTVPVAQQPQQPSFPAMPPQPLLPPPVQPAQQTVVSQEELRQRLAAAEEAASENTTLQQQEELSVRGPQGRQIVMQRLMRPPSRVVVLKNMVTSEEVDDSLQDEITDECNRFGQVEKVIIYQEAQGEFEGAEVIVKIFVEFKDSSMSENAKSALDNRYFGGRLVSAELYDMYLYEANDLSA